MVDQNTGVSMYESDAIIKYLSEKYGDGTVPLSLSFGALTAITVGFAIIGRAGKGNLYTPAKLPPKPLEFWAYEVFQSLFTAPPGFKPPKPQRFTIKPGKLFDILGVFVKGKVQAFR